ncbi:MAG TPA: SIS domain-containing protein [bacterium]|nr:SIS domain-containing protein [bacterium]
MSRNDAARRGARAYTTRLRACLGAVPAGEIAAVADRLHRIARAGGAIFLAGNGGSAATATHVALDLGKSTLGRPPRLGAKRVRTVALCEPAALTAWANDHGYEYVFAEQIRTLARPGDAVLLFSVSGNSPNIVAAARAARATGAVVIALVGRPGGAVRTLADLVVVVPSDEYELVEDVHLAIGHILTVHLRGALRDAGTRPGRRRRTSGRTRARRSG